MNDSQFARHVRHLLFAWIALLALMLASLGSAYLSLGIGNVAAGIVIAVVKSAIVVALFMRMASASAVVRIAAAAALATWLLLIVLSGVDYATRPSEPADYQAPRQIPPLGAGTAGTRLAPPRGAVF
jgi:cytochrome c oxidase subunit 4